MATPVATITTLIDKQDTIEIVRDQLGGILKAESVGQMALAVTAAEDPELWDLRVFTERQRTLERWLNTDDDAGRVPVINVWAEGAAIEESKSSVIGRTVYRGRFNIDGYSRGRAQDVPAGGHMPADLDGALERDRAARLVRNILAATTNADLQMAEQQLLWGSLRVMNYDFFIPTVEDHPVPDIRAFRFFVEVVYTEVAPEYQATTLESVEIDILRDSITGEILAEVDFDYT